ncbi:MAG: YfhO family protein [Clostridia bacterium]|nr:YfhO family protein [Clostridia bacterium]
MSSLVQNIKNFFNTPSENTPETPLKKEGFFYKNRYVFLSFIIPFLLMLYAFYRSDFFPFGNNQIMVIDMWHQYFPFFNDMHDKLQNGGSMLYTWNGGLGTNFIALISYYAASPLYLLSVFCPAEYLTEAMAVVVMLKIAFAGAFMCIYLRGMHGRCDIGTATFSILYALSAYAMGYYWCLMWLDVFALLPLCILGLNKLIDEGKFRMYTISLAFIMITNYYIGVMMCIFIMIYYPILYFSRVKAKGAKYCAITTTKAVLFSAIGVAMAAFILLPTYLSMQNTYYIDGKMPESSNFYNPILDVFSNLLPNVALTVRGGLPNIYCGLLSAMLAVLFLMCKSVPAKQKVLNCIILGFLVLSFNWNKLDFIWHGFHFPNELPYRYSFVFSFILITMAYQAFLKLNEITPKQIGVVTACGFIYILFAEKLYSDKFDYKVIYISLLFLALYAIAFAIYKTGKFKESLIGMLLFLIVFGEMTNYTVTSVQAVGHSDRPGYFLHRDDLEDLIAKVEKEDESFYRMELANPWTTNSPALYTYKGVSQFSSEINCNVTAMMKNLGLAADPGSNRFGYFMSTPVLNAMLNIKYVMGKNQTVNDYALDLLYEQNGSTIYRNKYDLSIAYMVKNNTKNWAYENSNPFESQIQFIKSATGITSPVMNALGDPVITGSNVICGSYYDGKASCSPENFSGSSSITLEFTSPITQPIYAFVESHGADSIVARTTGGTSVTFENNRGSIMGLGTVRAGEKVYVDVYFPEGKANMVTSYVYGVDTTVWDRAYAVLNDEALEVTKHSDTMIEGNITVKQDGLLMTSIPYEKGWSVYVDGKKAEVIPLGDAFVTLDLKTGTHKITFKYAPAGFYAGVAISVGSLALMIALWYVLKKYDQKIAQLVAIEKEMSAEDIEDIVEQVESTEGFIIEEQPLEETEESINGFETIEPPVEQVETVSEPVEENASESDGDIII